MDSYLKLVMFLAYGPLAVILLLYLIAALLCWSGRSQFWNWLVKQTRYERNGQP